LLDLNYLIRKKSNTNDYIKVYVNKEVNFTAESGFSTTIPLNSKWNTVGIQVSGGLDSALLLYLTAKAIQENNLDIKIQPISVFIPSKVKNIASTEAIIAKVRELTEADFIKDGLIFDMPEEETTTHDGKKDKFFVDMIDRLFKSKKIDFVFNGNTKNPPVQFRKNWKNDEYRQKNRDNAMSIYNSYLGASPHYNIDKADIINLYLQHDIFDQIVPLTCSCDENIDYIHRKKLNVPCGSCWWCEERNYGFQANNVEDIAPILSYEQYLQVPSLRPEE